MAITRNGFLNNRKTQIIEEAQKVQAAKNALEADTGRIDKINDGLPLLASLIEEVRDATLRGEWLLLHDEYSKVSEDWDRNINSWDAKLAKLQQKLDEVDRLIVG